MGEQFRGDLQVAVPVVTAQLTVDSCNIREARNNVEKGFSSLCDVYQKTCQRSVTLDP